MRALIILGFFSSNVIIYILPDTITSLKKENDALKREIESLKTNFGKLQEMMERHEELAKQDGPCKILQTQIHTLQISLQINTVLRVLPKLK